ncbi:hypothetical protein V6N11_068645 [Hibiscus sabdariffa]|uniref:Uncharacterized protein n=1 Tax=Hibiscus sabdariffa TaxID=183260 RepID=A0ABR2PAC2_9ROSI
MLAVDGGPAAKELIPKLDLAKKHISSQLHVDLPDIEKTQAKQLVPAALALKGLGAILCVWPWLWSLPPDRVFAGLYDFYNYGPEEPQYSVLLNDFLQVFTYTYLKCSTHIMACKLHRHILLLGDNKEATKEAENRLEFIKVVTSEDSCLAVPDNILLV